MAADDLLIVAGEASGDLHGARLLTEILRLRPTTRAFGLGSDELRAAGLDLLADSREVAVVGIVEVLKVLRRARGIFRELLAEVDRRQAATAVLIDFPDFNLRLARQLKRRGVRVVYYISPQIWAWRRGRVKAIARDVDRMLVLFPFEREFYRRAGVAVEYVGHPLVDEVPAARRDARPDLDDGPLRLALLPGSRDSEIEALLPTMLQALEILSAGRLVEPCLVQAPSVSREVVARHLGCYPVEVRVETTDRFAAVAGCHLAVCASGTATLEVGLLETPMVVVYKLAWGSSVLARLMVRLEHVSLVNLVLGRGVVPELMQGEFTAPRLAQEIESLASDRGAWAEMRTDLGELRSLLGRSGASGRAAEAVCGEML